jgi:hypothetical protein
VLDNAMLLEQLVTATAEGTRPHRRDLHDSASIYVSLKFAIGRSRARCPADLWRAGRSTMASEDCIAARDHSGLRGAGGER